MVTLPRQHTQAAAVLFIIIQGPKGDGMVNSLNESRMMGNFTQTRNFVSVLTWGLVAGFLVLSAASALRLGGE